MVTLAEPCVIGVVTFDAFVDDPAPNTVNEPPTGAGTGPELTTGQLTNAVTRVHNCGASPITLISAETVVAPIAPRMFTTKLGLCPDAAIESELKSTSPELMGTSFQLGISTPAEFSTVSVALVKPEVGDVSANDFHP